MRIEKNGDLTVFVTDIIEYQKLEHSIEAGGKDKKLLLAFLEVFANCLPVRVITSFSFSEDCRIAMAYAFKSGFNVYLKLWGENIKVEEFKHPNLEKNDEKKTS